MVSVMFCVLAISFSSYNFISIQYGILWSVWIDSLSDQNPEWQDWKKLCIILIWNVISPMFCTHYTTHTCTGSGQNKTITFRQGSIASKGVVCKSDTDTNGFYSASAPIIPESCKILFVLLWLV